MRIFVLLFCLSLMVWASSYEELVDAIINKQSDKALALINTGIDLKQLANEESIKRIVTPNVHTTYVGGMEQEVFPLVILAATAGMNKVIKAIKSKDEAAIYVKDSYGNDALMWASRQGNLETVKLLLTYGFNPLYQPKGSKHSAYELAIQKAKYDVLNLYVDELLKSNETEQLSYTIWALARHKSSIIEKLLQHGIKDSYKGYAPRTSLIKAAEVGDIKTFELLVQYGSDPYEGNIGTVRDGYNPLIAALHYSSKMARYLLNNYNYDLTVLYEGENLLHIAFEKFNEEIFTLLLQKSHLNINSKDNRHGEYFLQKAVYHNDLETVEYLLKHKLSKEHIQSAIQSAKEKTVINEKQYQKVDNSYNSENLQKSKKILILLESYSIKEI
ncbi:MAG: ankyrin repeat domain-containing protein [Candidatus Marinarcus sp.]|uniref:ankyrin repeat domain-containing protein n=1 Tax=Candidatus Marinarcus sp. TaxID=3100987 RepID=UPI003AFF70BA